MNSEALPVSSLWRHRVFQQLFWAHVLSLVGSGLSSLALGLLAHELVGSSASTVLGLTLTIRIIMIVACSPWTGQLAERWGAKRLMVLSDIVRAVVMMGFFIADAVWQIYALAVLLNLGSAVFTPIYRAVIPGVVTREQYSRALAIGSVAYDAANILGPSLAALVIAVAGFRGNFVIDAITFLGSAALLFGLPRLASEATAGERKAPASMWHGLHAMVYRPILRRSLFLALQTSIGGAFVIVATVDFVKNDLGMTDTAYALVMGLFGVGSVCAAIGYGKASKRVRDIAVMACAPAILASLAAVAFVPVYSALCVAWWFIGMSYSTLGVRSSELLAEDSEGSERTHIYAAHFALSHAGWGVTYPLAGFITTAWGFPAAAGLFSGIIALVSLPLWLSMPKTSQQA